MTKRLLDIFLSAILLIATAPLMLVVYLFIALFDGGRPVHFSKRIGRANKIFLMPKFRTMKLDTPQLATHLIQGQDFVTPLGKILRKFSLDELPQLFSVLKGDMTLVGPRPALYNQDDLVKLRTERGIHLLPPGLTGWAQINGRDSVSLEKKVALDAEYLSKRGLYLDCKILFLTLWKALAREGISH